MNRIKHIIIFIVVVNFLLSLIISIQGLITNTYFNDYNNFKSLKFPEKYMVIDTLLFEGAYDYSNTNDDTTITFIVNGVIQSTKNKINLVVGNEKYFNYNLDKYPVYKSKLTNDFFLKNAPKGYYWRQYKSFILTMYLKLSLFPLIGFIIYMYKKSRI